MSHHVVDTPHIKGNIYEYEDFPDRRDMGDMREFFKLPSVQQALDDGDFDFIYESAYFRGDIPARELTAVLLSSGIDILPHVKNIHVAMFSRLEGLTSVTIPSNIQSISNSAFLDCVALESVEFKGFRGIIGDSAFKGCNHLRNLHLSKDISQIHSGAFSSCDALQNILFDGSWEEFKMLLRRSFPFTGLERSKVIITCNDGTHQYIEAIL